MRILKNSLVLLLLAISACAPSATARMEEELGLRTTLRVENRNFYEMTIYVIQGGTRTRVGSVPGLSTRRLTLREEFTSTASPIQFLADPVGSRFAPISQELMVRPGDEVGLIIPP